MLFHRFLEKFEHLFRRLVKAARYELAAVDERQLRSCAAPYRVLQLRQLFDEQFLQFRSFGRRLGVCQFLI